MTVIDRVRQLLEAENHADRKQAEAILAPDFVAITRRNGDEEGRDRLLDTIQSPPVPNLLREPDEFRVWESGDIAVVRSRVRTRHPTTRAVIGGFRNLHVFRKESHGWLCVDWQVTELKDHETHNMPVQHGDGDRIWDEYKYRHQHTWNAVFKLTLAVLAISVVPYTQETVVCVIGRSVIFLPVLAVFLGIFGLVVVWRELRILNKIRELHRRLQGTTSLGRDWFQPLVLMYLGALAIAALLNWRFVTIWQETISTVHPVAQCFESPTRR